MNKFSFKNLIKQLDIRQHHRVPIIHQTESSECALACLAMICGYYGKNIDMIALRQQFNLSSRGTTLSGVTNVAKGLGLITRPLSLELNEIHALKLPCILHWEFNHFVLLVSTGKNHVVLHDPSRGRRTVSFSEMSKRFTGVAIEAWPGSVFTMETARNQIKIGTLMSSVTGLKKALCKIFCISVVIETINLVMPVGTQLVMDHAIPAGDDGLLTLICIGLMIFILLRTTINMVRSWSSLIITTLVNIQLKSGLFNYLLCLPLSYFERRKLGDIQSRFSSLSTICETFTSAIVGMLMDSIMVVGVVVMMLLYGGWLTWFVLGFTVVNILIRLATYDIYRQLSEEALIKDARVGSYFMETLYGIATVKMQGMSERQGTHWLNLEIDATNTDIKVTKFNLLFGGVNSFLGACDQVLILLLGANLVIDNEMTIGMFIAFGAFREQFTDRVFSLTNFFLRLRIMNLHSDRIADIAMHPKESIKPEIPIDDVIRPLSLEGCNLAYSYDCQSPMMFSGLCIHILPGESIAIIGQSGSGKTTLMKILCGLFEPDEGTVIVDGKDIQKLGINNYQKMIGCVMQDDKLFSGSIRENICGFDEREKEDWMIECAKASYIHDFIIGMPMGYDTLIGELGGGLSGGQKQRIFIARALYRKPGIIFMDEATSALDAESEKFVNQSIKQLNITRVIIAHRETTISSADRVIDLNNKSL